MGILKEMKSAYIKAGKSASYWRLGSSGWHAIHAQLRIHDPETFPRGEPITVLLGLPIIRDESIEGWDLVVDQPA